MRNRHSIHSSILLVLTLLLLTSCGKNATQEGLAHVAFNYLKNNNFKGYSKYLLTTDETLDVLNELEHSKLFKSYSKQKKQRYFTVRQNIKSHVSRLHKKLEKNFRNILAEGIKKGVDWKKTKFVKIKIGPEDQVYDLGSVPSQHIYIVFKQGKKEYMLRLSNNIKTRRGWVIVDGLNWEEPDDE